MMAREVVFNRYDRSRFRSNKERSQRFILRGGQHPSSIQNVQPARQRWNGTELATLEVLHREERNLETRIANSIHFSRELFVRLSWSQRITRIEQMRHLCGCSAKKFSKSPCCGLISS